MAAIPFVLFVLGASTGAVLDLPWLTEAMAVCLVSIVPLAVALSIEQHHLYDVDRPVSRAEMAGGTLTVRPRGGQGTVVIAELPYAS
jgi:hypothetical protein